MINGDVPGVIVSTPASGLHVIEGTTSNANSAGLTQYTVSLTSAPAAAETVTVTPQQQRSAALLLGAADLHGRQLEHPADGHDHRR